jgi:ornithine cyclodeaminase/alanine dehydrogenase-like protein (mu-crystallin family)
MLADCLPVVEEAFRRHGTGTPPQSLGIHAAAGTFHIKTALGDAMFAAKINANFPGNPQRHGLPTIQGVIVLIVILSLRRISRCDGRSQWERLRVGMAVAF